MNKSIYTLVRITQSTCPSFETLESFMNYDVALLNKAKYSKDLTENQTIQIKETSLNDSEGVGVFREGIELYVSDDYDNRHYMDVNTYVDDITVGPYSVGKTNSLKDITLHGQDVLEMGLSKDIRKEIERDADDVINHMNEAC